MKPAAGALELVLSRAASAESFPGARGIASARGELGLALSRIDQAEAFSR